MSSDFVVEGLVYGEGKTPELPFPLQKGSKETAAGYGVIGVPTIVIVQNGVVRQRISGARDIHDAKVVLKAMARGARTVSEALEKAPAGNIIVTGWIVNRGTYFKQDLKLFITDRQKELAVRPWLPLEAIKSPVKDARPRLTSDVVNAPVVLKGRVVKSGADQVFQVTEEIFLD